MPAAPLYPRFLERDLLEALEDSPVVLVHGPRQCGKTTFTQSVCAPDNTTDLPGDAETDYRYISFDDDVVRAGEQSDPTGFVADLPERAILDEVQRIPEIFSALKPAVDRRRTPARSLLTGSTSVLLLPALADSLAGRMLIVELPRTCKEAREARVDVLGRGIGATETSACCAAPAGEAETQTQSGSGGHAWWLERGPDRCSRVRFPSGAALHCWDGGAV